MPISDKGVADAGPDAATIAEKKKKKKPLDKDQRGIPDDREDGAEELPVDDADQQDDEEELGEYPDEDDPDDHQEPDEDDQGGPPDGDQDDEIQDELEADDDFERGKKVGIVLGMGMMKPSQVKFNPTLKTAYEDTLADLHAVLEQGGQLIENELMGFICEMPEPMRDAALERLAENYVFSIAEALAEKAYKHDVPVEVVLEVFRRGWLAGYDHPKLSEQEVAFNRVNSWLSGGLARQIDRDLLAEGWWSDLKADAKADFDGAKKSISGLKDKLKAKTVEKPITPQKSMSNFAKRNQQVLNQAKEKKSLGYWDFIKNNPGQAAASAVVGAVTSPFVGGAALELMRQRAERKLNKEEDEQKVWAIATRTRKGHLRRVPDTRFDSHESATRYGDKYHTGRDGAKYYTVVEHPDSKKKKLKEETLYEITHRNTGPDKSYAGWTKEQHHTALQKAIARRKAAQAEGEARKDSRGRWPSDVLKKHNRALHDETKHSSKIRELEHLEKLKEENQAQTDARVKKRFNDTKTPWHPQMSFKYAQRIEDDPENELAQDVNEISTEKLRGYTDAAHKDLRRRYDDGVARGQFSPAEAKKMKQRLYMKNKAADKIAYRRHRGGDLTPSRARDDD